ncbi:MAG: flagellar motor switch protein FliN [Oligoflexia bacterium]|nr:flagellar motor switch protein FliN [Oligoflexia bacterium]
MTEKEAAADNRTLEFLNDVAMRVTVEFGRAKTSIRKMLNYQKGSVLELEKMSGEPLDIRLNGKLIARGEAVIVNDRFGVRVTEIVSPEDFEASLAAGKKK